MRIKPSKSELAFNTLGYAYITFLALFCLLPFWMVVSASFTSESAIYTKGYGLIPPEFSTFAYRVIFKSSAEILRAYGVTIFITAAGSLSGLFLTAMTAYVLYRRDFRYRNAFSLFFFFTTMFSGGLIPWYIIMVSVYHLKNSILSLILPGMLGAFNIILMKNFMNSIPDSIVESAKIDGAGDFRIFIRLILPLSVPALATIGLFLALEYWNAWMPAMLFIENRKLYPLQYFLYKMISSINFVSTVSSRSSVPVPDLPKESIKMATSVVVIGPVILFYPFVQKYFVKGITIGAVKG